ncbi:TonB-dependent receptor [Telluribacter sp. SYSU D00476]|uniref:TonB-dependent receptor n=1 Tax=Telluribacter sp. SYSU D00476 TaxID=2811430 RepID=UPI001FF20CC4|nr:TonB-dependent receptor [Telluribacter sp. SYSU D00476]
MMNTPNTLRTLALLIVAGFVASNANAQQRGEIESQTYEIVKEKSIEFPQANRLFDKVQPIQPKSTDKKVNYEFLDPRIDVSIPKLTPTVVASSDEKTRQEQPEPLNNYIKLGGGNYGRFLGDAFVSTRATQDLVFTAKARHLSAATGPVQGKLSANANTMVDVGAKYIRNAFKVEGNVDYNRDNYYFYGFRPQPDEIVINRDSIRQTLNRFGLQLAFENTDPSTTVDYAVRTSVYSLRDRYNASEMDWGTNLNTSLPISEKFIALFDADAYVSQRVDAETFNRNLFRVKPMFKYVDEMFSVTAGVNAVNETDNGLNINRTRAYPVINLDVIPVSGMHVFAGWNGDIVRNTLRSLLSENLWLAPNVLVANTEKASEIYGGVKGEHDGLNYEGRVAYTNYRNFYVFNNSYADTSKFAVLYDGVNTRVLTISAQAGYNFNELYKTSLKANYFDYGMDRLEAAWHRPNFTLNWFNAVTISKKLFLTTDFYLLTGIKAKNFQTGEAVKLPPIADLNLKIDYLLTRNFSAFVSINNILGKQYQRYLYYPNQGLNFVGGLSFSF